MLARSPVSGDPTIVEGRLVNVGRGVSGQFSIVALDPQNGGSIWRHSGEHFSATVVAEKFLWYVTGSQTDNTSVTLYRIDVRSGEQKQMASWRRPDRVDQAWIAYEGGRVFVATASPDLDKSTVELGIDCFDAGTGARQWQKTKNAKMTAIDLGHPIVQFVAQTGSLTYAIAEDRWSVRTTDGSALASLPIPVPPVNAPVKPAMLWPPSSFQIQGGRLYAFTADGHAYAMIAR